MKRELHNKDQDFDLVSTSLEGTTLIEASAGTGKTYAITGLYIRLLLEKNLNVNQILVVTFTEAATDELKDRIRSKIRYAIDAFKDGKCEEEFLFALIKKHEAESSVKQLEEALRDFDEAAIFTIHGFCRRVLTENAFESGSLFDTELVTDQSDIKKEIVEDFWRSNFYNASQMFAHYAVEVNALDQLFELMNTMAIEPDVEVIPKVENIDTLDLEKEYSESFEELRALWKSSKEAVKNILLNDTGLHGNKYRKVSIPGWIESMDIFLSIKPKSVSVFEQFKKFTAGEINSSLKKDCSAPSHSFFDAADKFFHLHEKLTSLYEQRLLALKLKLIKYGQAELEERKQRKNIQSFDDLLLKLRAALQIEDKGGSKLAKSVGEKFKAALIDEFQDTDPIQYFIFNKIFGRKDNVLFLIGDPKQAIYGFRGADIFAYLRASKHVERKFTLGENWRSESGLITALNSIFNSASNPFLFDGIDFKVVNFPTEKKDSVPLHIDEENGFFLHLWYLDSLRFGQPGKPVGKTRARTLVSNSVAAEISRLLQLGRIGKARLGDRNLREGDIAVLVRRNEDARIVQNALNNLQIHSVLFNAGNLFFTPEALEVERILRAVSEPQNESYLKTALATSIIGLTGEQIESLMDLESDWEKWIVKFQNYKNLWNQYGFIRMFKTFISSENVLSLLMSFTDGERRNTNVLHLSEVLHQISIDQNLSMSGLIKWLSEKRSSAFEQDEEHQLRLESDENAVKLVTMHKSKGLEYPVVFCPFLWDGSLIENSNRPVKYHNEAQDMNLVLDLGSENKETHKHLAEKELLAENLRLMYVALTRAKSRCYFIWGKINKAETSAPAYIFHQPKSIDAENILGEIGERFKNLTDEEIQKELNQIVKSSGKTISLYNIPDEEGKALSPETTGEKLVFNKYSTKIDQSYRIASFSSLVSGQSHFAEIADYDAIPSPPSSVQFDFDETGREEKPEGAFAFPKGRKAGKLMHDIFEHLDFQEKNELIIKQLVTQKLIDYGFDAYWDVELTAMIKQVLSAQLDTEINDLRLSKISNEERLNELEFYFPMKLITPSAFKKIFTGHPGINSNNEFPQQLEKLTFFPQRGFMKGFIDLVFKFGDRFYLVDWKSNHLGNNFEDYNQSALKKEMAENYYFFQYHLYTVAIDQYLKLRMPGYSYEKHFGGVYYIFLRGVSAEPGTDLGIYKDKPDPQLIKKLSNQLLDII